MNFFQTKVTPIVEGYGGWAFRLEIVPIESSFPGYGKLVVSFHFRKGQKKSTKLCCYILNVDIFFPFFFFL